MTNKSLIKICNQPVVVLPLKEWEKIEDTIDDLEDSVRFQFAYKKSCKEKSITLNQLKKKYALI